MESLVESFFFFQHFEYLITLLLAPVVSDEKLAVNDSFYMIGSFLCLQESPFVFLQFGYVVWIDHPAFQVILDVVQDRQTEGTLNSGSQKCPSVDWGHLGVRKVKGLNNTS